MVIQRTIEHLKTRPKDERKLFATSVAFGVVIILFSLWVFMFVRGIGSAASAQQAAATQALSEAAADVSSAGQFDLQNTTQ